MWVWNCGKDDLTRRTNVSSTYLHQTVGMTGTGFSIASSNHSMKILANTGEIGEPTMEEHYLYERGRRRATTAIPRLLDKQNT